MFKRILIPLDGSSTSERGLDVALKLAAEQEAAVCLFHVVDEHVLTQAVDAGADMIDNMISSMRASGRKVLDKAAAKAAQRNVKARTVLVENIVHGVADVILDQAKAWKADLIVMGTHGRRGFTRVVMGSAAEGVVRGAAVPVLLVKAAGARPR